MIALNPGGGVDIWTLLGCAALLDLLFKAVWSEMTSSFYGSSLKSGHIEKLNLVLSLCPSLRNQQIGAGHWENVGKISCQFGLKTVCDFLERRRTLVNLGTGH